MKFSVPWSVKGIRPEARETAREAARRAGMPLGEWLNSVIIQQAAEDGVRQPSLGDDDSDGDDLSSVHQRLDDLTRRVEQVTRTGPAAYAPKRTRDEPNQIAELVARLDRRLDQFANSARPAAPPPAPSIVPQAMPNMPAPTSLDRAVAEIAARQRALNGQPGPIPAPQRPPAAAAAAAPAAPSPMLAPMPAQDLSGLEQHLRQITDQIETLRRPGVEEAINSLREELGEIGHALTEAMPRREIETIERQISGLSQRIAEGRQAGVDAGALSGVEHGLAEVRDVLRGLTPAENLVGYNDAIAGLAHKIDQIVVQKDPATLEQLEQAITTLREMAAHVASDETVGMLANQVHTLAEKVDQISMSAGASDALNSLEHRISALSDALEQRAQSGGTVPPMLESLVQSLSDKIELIQQSRGDNVAFGHLEDRIVSLVQRLDASDSRLGHLEAIERGLADLLVNIEEMRANKNGLRADGSPGVDSLKHEIARTQDALQAVHGTLGQVVDRLGMIESNIRGDGRSPLMSDPDTLELTQPFGRVAARAVGDAPPQPPAPTMAPPPEPAPRPAPQAAPTPEPPPAPAPKRLPPAGHLPINPDLPPDQPLEPGSGMPRFDASARIAASEAALGTVRATPPPKSSFIAAARRAAQAAGETASVRAPQAARVELLPEALSLRDKMMQRVKSLFIAASIIAIVIGGVQIAATMFDFGNSGAPSTTSTKAPDAAPGATRAPASIAANPLEPPKLPNLGTGFDNFTPPFGNNTTAASPPLNLNPTPPSLPSLINPRDLNPPPRINTPMLNTPAPEQKSDITGSITRPGTNPKTAPAASDPQNADKLPIAIGSAKLRNAATAGDGAAAFEVAVRYAEGRGVPVNLEEAARWYERAASKGLAPAQFRYASQLEKGQGVKKDLNQARKLYLAAAAKGNAKAMHNLAVLYAEGIDGKPDYAASAQWFRKAAQRGIADSQYNLGVLCARGLGTEKNFAESYQWFALAAIHGDKEAAKKRDEIASQLDAASLATAQQTVKDFTAEPQPEDANAVAQPRGGWDQGTAAPPPRVTQRRTPAISADMFDIGKR